MTIGLRPTSNYYLELITEFPPRPIANQDELLAVQTRINTILDGRPLNQDDREYLKVMGMLIYDYEEEHEPIPKLSHAELIQSLMDESELELQDAISLFGTESNLRSVLANERELTTGEISQIAQKFHLSPLSFFAGV